MNFRVQNGDGPARIGQLIIEDKNVVTPNIFFLDSPRCKAPDFSDIILTDRTRKTKISTIRIGESIFSTANTKEKNTVLLNKYMIYPKDVTKELLLSTIAYNKNVECILV